MLCGHVHLSVFLFFYFTKPVLLAIIDVRNVVLKINPHLKKILNILKTSLVFVFENRGFEFKLGHTVV